MIEVTESDKGCIPAHILGGIPKVWHKAIHTAVATHREAAAKAVTDRLRDLPDELELALNAPSWSMALTHVHNAATALAAALGKQHD